MSSIVPIDYGPNANAVGRLGTIIVYPIEALIYEVTITAQNACPCCCRFCCGRYPDGSLPPELYLTFDPPVTDYDPCRCWITDSSFKMTLKKTNPLGGNYIYTWQDAWVYEDPLFPSSKRVLLRPQAYNKHTFYQLPDYETSGFQNCYIRIRYDEMDVDPLFRKPVELERNLVFRGDSYDIYKIPASIEIHYYCQTRLREFCDKQKTDNGEIEIYFFFPYLYFPDPPVAGKARWGMTVRKITNPIINYSNKPIECDPYYQEGAMSVIYSRFQLNFNEAALEPWLSLPPEVTYGFLDYTMASTPENPNVPTLCRCGPYFTGTTLGSNNPCYLNGEFFGRGWTVTE